MSIREIVQIELRKINLKKYVQHVLIANLAIILLVLMAAILTSVSDTEMPQITTVSVIDTFVKATFVVWESVLIANLIIEEFRSKTVLILFSYPLERKKIMISKLVIVGTMILISMVASQIFQNILFGSLGTVVPFIDYSISLSEIGVMGLTTITAILLGLLPMYVGMLNKSTVATVVSSILIVALTISSGGQNGAGLITMVPVSIAMGAIGIVLALTALKKMLSEDIIL